MASSVCALRGATTIERDTREDIETRVRELVHEMFERNDLTPGDAISLMFTATPDITSAFPATAARGAGLEDVPLIGAQELDVRGALPLCIRILMHCESATPRSQLQHVFLHGAARLRPDLAK